MSYSSSLVVLVYQSQTTIPIYTYQQQQQLVWSPAEKYALWHRQRRAPRVQNLEPFRFGSARRWEVAKLKLVLLLLED